MADVDHKKAKALQVFQTLDGDGNGTLTHEELAEIIPAESLQGVIDEIDPDNKGSITFQEFYEGFGACLGEADDDDGPTLGGAEIRMDVIQQKADERSNSFSAGLAGDGDDDDSEDTDSAIDARFKKVGGWMNGSNQLIGQAEVNTTIKFLCKRPFSSKEERTLKDIFGRKGFATVSSGAIWNCLDKAHKAERGNNAWDNDRFIFTFLDKAEKGLASQNLKRKDSTKMNGKSNLLQLARALWEKNDRLKADVKKIKQRCGSLDDENQELQDQLGSGGARKARAEAEEKARTEQIKSFESMIEQLEDTKGQLEREFKNLKQEHQNDRALLKVKQTMIGNTNTDLEALKKKIDGLLKSHAEQNKLELKKKCGKMTAIQARRRFIRELQVDNERIPQLEVENQRLKKTVGQLHEEAKEYLRIMDSYRDNERQTPVPGVSLDFGQNKSGIVMGDADELKELREEVKLEIEKNTSLTTEFGGGVSNLDENKSSRAVAEEKVKDLEGQVEVLTGETSELSVKITGLETELSEEKNSRTEAVQQLEAQVTDREEKITVHEQELVDEIAAKEALQEQLSKLGDDSESTIKQMTQEITDLKQKIKEMEAQVESDTRTREVLESDLERAKAELENEQIERKNLEEELTDVKQQLVEAKKKIVEIEGILSTKQCEVCAVSENKCVMEVISAIATDICVDLSPDQQAELSAYARCFNKQMGGDDEIKYLLPINENTPELLAKLKDGVFIAKYINMCVPDTIDIRALNTGAMSAELMRQNLTMAIQSSKAIGIAIPDVEHLINQLMTPTDPVALLDFLFNLIKTKYFQHVTVREHPELLDICENPDTGLSGLKLKEVEPDSLQSFMADKLLLRWVNWHHLAEADGPLEAIAKDWGDDLCDGKAYSTILDRISVCKGEAIEMKDTSTTDGKRARHVIEKATVLGIDHFHQPNNITGGSDRLNLLLSACMFCSHTGISDDDEFDSASSGSAKRDKSGANGEELSDEMREERAYRMWINSCGIDDCYVNNLFLDTRDGLKVLKLIDHVRPGTVKWKKVEKNPKGKFKKVSNCNLIIKYCKKPLNLKIKLISGTDLAEGSPKLIMAIMGQLMRYDTMLKLQAAFLKIGLKGGQNEEKAILGWANEKVASNHHKLNPLEKLKSFKDKRLTDSLFFFNLLWVISPKLIKWKMVNTDAKTPQDKARNAGYVISVARKMGGEVYLLPHDIVDAKAAQIMLFLGSIMLVASQKK